MRIIEISNAHYEGAIMRIMEANNAHYLNGASEKSQQAGQRGTTKQPPLMERRLLVMVNRQSSIANS